MEDVKKTWSKYCIVPMCKSRMETAPEKIYFYVPKNADIRKKWFKAMKKIYVSSLSSLYCCEDHFNVEQDTENYMQYKLMTLQHGKKVTLRLKKDIIPYKFQCQQKEKQKLPPEGTAGLNLQRLAPMEDPLALTSPPIPGPSAPISVVYLPEPDLISTSAPSKDLELNNSVSENDRQATTNISNRQSKSVLRINKAVQVDCKVQCRSIGVNVNLIPKKHDRATSPLLLPIKNYKRKNSSRSLLKSNWLSKKRKLSVNNPADDGPVTSVISPSSEYKPESSSSSSLLYQSNRHLQSKILMCIGSVTVVEKEPQMLLGLP